MNFLSTFEHYFKELLWQKLHVRGMNDLEPILFHIWVEYRLLEKPSPHTRSVSTKKPINLERSRTINAGGAPPRLIEPLTRNWRWESWYLEVKKKKSRRTMRERDSGFCIRLAKLRAPRWRAFLIQPTTPSTFFFSARSFHRRCPSEGKVEAAQFINRITLAAAVRGSRHHRRGSLPWKNPPETHSSHVSDKAQALH